MMMKLILCFLFSLGCASAQGDVVTQTLATNSTSDSLITASVRNIGQSYHIGTVIFFNNGVQTCNVPGGTFFFQASYDGTNWIEPEQRLYRNTSGGFNFYNARMTGAFPFVRLFLTSWNETDCVATVTYSGTRYPTVDPQIKGAGGEFGSLSAISFFINSATTTTVIASSTTSNQKLKLHCLYLYNAGAQNVILREKQAGGATTEIVNWNGMPAGKDVTLGCSGVAWKQLLTGSGLEIVTSAASVVSGFVVYGE